MRSGEKARGVRGSAWTVEVGLALLVILSLGIIAGGDRLVRSSVILTPGSGLPTAVRDDSFTGGDSTARLEGDGSAWSCQLGDAYAYHFCAFEVLIDPKRQKGIDMSAVDSVRLWLDYEGGSRTVRVFLRNYDRRYSRPSDPITTKFNQIEFSKSLTGEVVELPLRDFFVANWWMTQYNVPPHLSRPQFDNIVVVEVQTGTRSASGPHRFQLRRIELVGRYLSDAQLYLGILLAWLGLVTAFVAQRLLVMKREIQKRRAKETELLAINAMLDARSRVMEHEACTDALTGAFNRRGLQSALATGLADLRDAQKPLSLVIFDIDYFKRVNDTFGHAAGDQLLSQLSWLVRENIRDADLLARWGGEEFVVLCRDTNSAQATAFAEKLRLLISSYQFGDVRITASFGVATLTEAGDLDRLFDAADHALYEAKGAGRDRVVLSGASVATPTEAIPAAS